MQTRRDFIKTVPITAGAFAIGGSFLLENNAHADEPKIISAEPHEGHFDPKGKAPSKFTIEALEKARAALPLHDTRDFDEFNRGFIAPMKQRQIQAAAGHNAWDMDQFKFIDDQEQFDSVHASLHRIAKLNQNYGLYEVVPGIYQVRGFDLAQITFIR
ncbi:MAG TPA: twin-arginine translocation signal domain-containing protein, partial [Kiritimatiellia bacterium]|nr:twin-arginine translocation signal domain-containing protein [Kiritimatiellia bacterium]